MSQQNRPILYNRKGCTTCTTNKVLPSDKPEMASFGNLGKAANVLEVYMSYLDPKLSNLPYHSKTTRITNEKSIPYANQVSLKPAHEHRNSARIDREIGSMRTDTSETATASYQAKCLKT